MLKQIKRLQELSNDIDAARVMLEDVRKDIGLIDDELSGAVMTGGPVSRIQRKLASLQATERGLLRRIQDLEAERPGAERERLLAEYKQALQAAAAADKEHGTIIRELSDLENSIRVKRAELKRRRNRAINAHAANVERARAISRGQAATDPALAHELQNLREKYLA